jgi:hypothetical protein
LNSKKPASPDVDDTCDEVACWTRRCTEASLSPVQNSSMGGSQNAEKVVR